MSVKVIDLNETAKEEQPAPAIETVEEEAPEATLETANEIIEEAPAPVETVEQPKEQPKAKPKAKPKASDIVPCPDCNKNMTYKNLRCSHKCPPEPPPVKKQANPKPKAKQQAKPQQPPKPPPDVYYSESDDDEEPQQPMLKKKNKQPAQQPINPTTALFQHYQFLQNQMIQQKQERYNNLCMNMFSSKSKKR